MTLDSVNGCRMAESEEAHEMQPLNARKRSKRRVEGFLKIGKEKEKESATPNTSNNDRVKNSLVSQGLDACRKEIYFTPSVLRHTLTDPVFDYQFRVTIVGDSGVGKSSLLRSFSWAKFSPKHEATLGVDLFARILNVARSRVKLLLWDTAGQEKFRYLIRSYYRNCSGIVVAYSICQRESFDSVPGWMKEIKTHMFGHDTDPVVILVGCKSDLAQIADNRQVTKHEAEKLADSLSIPFIETSAKAGENVDEAFATLGKQMCQREKMRKKDGTEVAGQGDTSRLQEADAVQNDKCCFW